MNGQGPVQSIPLEQQLAKLEPLDSIRPTNEKSIAHFSGKEVKIALLTSLPFLLAGLLTVLTSLLLPLGLAFGLATAGYFAAGTIISVAIFCKKLADRKAQARSADSVFPFINQSPLPKTSGSSPSPSYQGERYRTPPANMEKQELPSFPLPNQKPHPTAASDQKPPLNIADAILESLLLEIATSKLAETADSISDEASLFGDSAFDVSNTSSQSGRDFSSDCSSASDSNYQSESEDDDDTPSDLSVNTLATTSISLQGDNRQTISDSVSLRVRAIDQLHDSDDQRERSHPSHSTDGQTDTLTSGTIADEWHPANQSQTATEQQIAIHNLTPFGDDSLPLEDANSRAPSLEIRESSTVLDKASAERQQSDISEDFGLPETFEEPLINDDRDEEKLSADEELSVFSSGLSSRVEQTAPTTQTPLSMAPLDDTAPEASRKAQPESITRKAVPLPDVPLQEVTHENSSFRLSKPLTLQKQSEKKAISDTSEKEAKVAFQSTDTHTLSAPDQQTGKRVPASVSDSPTALVRASERQVALIDHNINDSSPLADGKALYFNIQATDIGSRLQLRLTTINPDQDSIRPPAFLLKIEEGLMPTATRGHASSALAVPAKTHRHLKVTILINRDNPSSSTAITINRQVTPEVFAILDAQLHKSGTCDLTIDKNQWSALQLEKLFALEGASTLDVPGKITEIDATEHLLETTSDSDLFTSISLSPMIVTPDRVVGRQSLNKLTPHVSFKSDSAEMKAFDNSQSTSIHSDEHEIPASNVLDKTESSSPLSSKQEDPARTSTPIVVASPIPTLVLEQPLNVTIKTVDPVPEFERPEAMQPNVTELYESKQPVADVFSILTDPITDIGKPPLPVNQPQTDEQADIYESKAAKAIESHTPTNDDREEETPSSLIVSLANDDSYSLPESDLVSGVYTATGQSHSLPPFIGEKPHSHDRRALRLDGLNYGYLADTESISSDTSPVDSDSESDSCLTSQRIRVTEAAKSYEQADGVQRKEETQAFLTMLSTESDTLTPPESDLGSGVFTTTEQSHSMPIFTGARQPSRVRRAFSPDKLNYGHLPDTEYSSSDTSPLLSPAGSDFGLANQPTNVFSGADNAAPNQLGAMTPHSLDPAVSKNKTALDDKHKRVRGHASDPELTTQRKERLSGGTIPEKIAHHLPELSDFSSFGSFCIIDAQEVGEPDSIDDSYMDDWEDLSPFAQELKPFKQELEDAINKPLVLLEYLAHKLAYNLDGKTQVELPDHSDGNQRYNVQKVKEVPPGLNAYILYPENPDTEKPVDLKLIFRGTNPYDASAIRDLEPSGAGFDTMEKAAKTITRQLHNILKHYPGRAVSLTMTGHSLGGADAQNFFGHFLNPDISVIANETLTANPLLANIQKIVLFTKCSAGVPEITHNRVISALNRLNGQQEQTGIKTEIFHLKVEGDIVQATGDCHVGSSLEQELADVSILQIYPSNEASRVDRHTKKFFTDDANLAPIYWYKWMKNTTDKGMEDIRLSVRDTSRVLRSYPIKGAQWAIHSAASYWFAPREAMTEAAVLKDTTTAEQPEASTPFTSIRAESDDISASNPASLITHSTAETLKEEQKNEATIGTENKEASINNEGSAVHFEDITPIKTMGYANESDSEQTSDVEHPPLPTIWLPRGRKQKKSRLQKIIPHPLRKRPDRNLEITRAYDGSICYRLGLCGNKETKRKDIKPYDRGNNIKIEFIRRMLDDEQSFARACDPYNVIRDINADIEEEAKAKERFRYGILAKAEVTDKSLKGEAFRDATRPVSERAYWNFIARCQYDHSDTLDEESESNKGAFKYSFQLINKLACFNNEFGKIEHDFNQFLFKKELSTDDQKRLSSLLKRAGTLQKHADSCYQDCEKYNLDQKTIENILSKAVGSGRQNRQCQKLQKIQEGICGKLNEKPKSDTPELLQEINEADNEPVEPTTSSAYPDLQPGNNLLAENSAHDTGMDDVETGVNAEVDDVISLAGDMSFDLSSDDSLLSEDENDPIKQPDSLTDEQKLALMQHQANTGLQHLSLTGDDKLVISSADIPSATAMMGLYSDAQKALDGIHEQGKHRKEANDIIKDVSRYMSTIQEYFPADAFSLQAPPANAVRENMYSQLVDLGARYLIIKTGAEQASGSKDNKKVELAKCTEFLWQTQQAWKSASPDFVNGQVGAMLAIGLMRPEQKAFVFEVCLNTQIISLEEIRRNIKQLKDKQQELSLNLQDKTPDSEGYNDLTKRLVNIQQELSNFENQYSDLKSKESSGMKSQKDFLDDCYSQLSKKLQDDVAAGVKRYLNKYKDTGTELKKVKNLSKSVVSEAGPMLRKKSREYANENARRKSNDKQGIKCQQVKDERFNTLSKAIQTIIEKEIIHQLCSNGRHEVAHQLFRIDEEMISQVFGVQKLAYTEEHLNVIDAPMYQIYLQEEIRSLTTPQTRELNNHQMILDIERPGFACNVRKSGDTVLTFDHPNSFCKEWSLLSDTTKVGNQVSDNDKKKHAAEIVLKQLTDAFYDVLQEAGIEDKERTNHLVNIMLAHSHQGAYALSMAVSKTVQSELSKEVKPYLPLAPHIPEDLIPDPLVKEKGQSRWSHAEFSVSKDKKSMLLKKVFEWNIELHDKELNIIPGTTRRMRIETVFEIGLHNNCATTKSINVSEVERGRVS